MHYTKHSILLEYILYRLSLHSRWQAVDTVTELFGSVWYLVSYPLACDLFDWNTIFLGLQIYYYGTIGNYTTEQLKTLYFLPYLFFLFPEG